MNREVTEAMIARGIVALEDRQPNEARRDHIARIYLAMKAAQPAEPCAGDGAAALRAELDRSKAKLHDSLATLSPAAPSTVVSEAIQAPKEKVQQARNLLNTAIEELVQIQVDAVSSNGGGGR